MKQTMEISAVSLKIPNNGYALKGDRTLVDVQVDIEKLNSEVDVLFEMYDMADVSTQKEIYAQIENLEAQIEDLKFERREKEFWIRKQIA